MSEYRILISNDDGYNSPGIMALYAALQATLGSGVHLDVVAPEQDRSGASNSLTLDRPLSVRKSAQGFWYVNGTPTDCVHIAVTGFLPHRPNLVVSGINNGANMGDDTIYSGTVAAAMEGFQCGLPAIAFSLASKDFIHLDDAAKVAASFVQQFIRNPSPLGQCLLNVNIPPLPLESLGDFACTRLGKRHHAEPMIPSLNPKGETVYWIGPPGSAKDAGPGTDFHAVANGKVSVSPLKADLTDVALMDALQGWL